MIIPESVFKVIESDKEMAKAREAFPIAYFGDMIRYPKQARIIREYLRRQPKVFIITGWKRTAKTSIAAYLMSAWMLGALDRNWPGARTMGLEYSYEWRKRFQSMRECLIGGNTLNHVETVLLKEFQQLLPPSRIKKWFSRQSPGINVIGNVHASVRTYEQSLEVWKSGTFQRIHLDEEPPFDIFNECLNRMATVKGKIMISVALDDADVSYLPDLISKPSIFGLKPEEIMHVQLGVEDVPDEIFPQSEKERVYLQYDGTIYENAVRKGEFVCQSMKWWQDFDEKIHVIKPFPIPSEWRKWRAVDAGTASPTGAIWLALHPLGMLFAYREYYKKGTTIDTRCKDIIDASGNARVRSDGMWTERETEEQYEMTLLDHAEFKKDDHTGDTVDYEYVKAGLNVQAWSTLGQEARRDKMRKWLWVNQAEKHFITHQPGAPRFYVFDTCANLIYEARKKAFKRAVSNSSPIPEKKIPNKDDHLMDCCEGIVCELSYLVDGREIV